MFNFGVGCPASGVVRRPGGHTKATDDSMPVVP